MVGSVLLTHRMWQKMYVFLGLGPDLLGYTYIDTATEMTCCMTPCWNWLEVKNLLYLKLPRAIVRSTYLESNDRIKPFTISIENSSQSFWLTSFMKIRQERWNLNFFRCKFELL